MVAWGDNFYPKNACLGWEMKKEKDIGENAKTLRDTLQVLARTELPNRAAKVLAEKETGIKYSSIESMLYKNEGGLDSWATLLTYLFKIEPQQLDSFLIELKEIFKKRRKLKDSEIQWSKLGDHLSDDRKSFWCDVIRMMEDIESTYSIKIKKKK